MLFGTSHKPASVSYFYVPFIWFEQQAIRLVIAIMQHCITACCVSIFLQVQQWTYSSKTRTVRAAARAARESGVRIRELQPHEFDEEMRRKLQYEVSGEHSRMV
jgi:hypothetical protein